MNKTPTAPETNTQPASGYTPNFGLFMDLLLSWERSNNVIASNPATGNYVYRDANGILTDKYGSTNGTMQEMLRRTPEQSYARHRNGTFLNPGMDKLPAEMQHNVFDMGINAGPSRAIKLLQDVLARTIDPRTGQAYLQDRDLSRVDDTIAEASRRYIADHGIVGFNNAYAKARIDFYEDLSRRKPEKAVNLNGWRRRASGFAMSESVDFYRRAGFKIEQRNGQDVVLLPEAVVIDGKSFVRTNDPNAPLVEYDRWYWENVLRNAHNDRAKFDKRARDAMRYVPGPNGEIVGRDEDDAPGKAVPPIARDEWDPQDRELYDFLRGFVQLLLSILESIFGERTHQPVPDAPQHTAPDLGAAPPQPVPGHVNPVMARGLVMPRIRVDLTGDGKIDEDDYNRYQLLLKGNQHRTWSVPVNSDGVFGEKELAQLRAQTGVSGDANATVLAAFEGAAPATPATAFASNRSTERS